MLNSGCPKFLNTPISMIPLTSLIALITLSAKVSRTFRSSPNIFTALLQLRPATASSTLSLIG